MKRRRLGQHTLHDESLITRIAEYALLSKQKTVFEIGTGKGNLTRKLCASAKKVVSCELDRELHRRSKETLMGFENLELVCDDAFNLRLDYDILVSNLPYSRSSKFLDWLLGEDFERAVVMVQEEFADKLLAESGGRNYRAITAVAQAFFDIVVLENVLPDRFTPQPKVVSKLIMLEPRADRPSTTIVKPIKTLFSFRGRRLSTALSTIAKRRGIDRTELQKGISTTLLPRRIEKLEVDQLVKVAEITQSGRGR